MASAVSEEDIPGYIPGNAEIHRPRTLNWASSSRVSPSTSSSVLDPSPRSRQECGSILRGETNDFANESQAENVNEERPTLATWTLVELLINFAYFLCVIPYRIRRSSDEADSELTSSFLSKVLWVISNIASAVEMAAQIPLVVSLFQQEPNPFLYMQLGGICTSVLVRVAFFRMVLSKSKHLLLANHYLTKFPYDNCIINMKVAVVGLLLIGIFTFANVGLRIVFVTKADSYESFYSIGITETLATMECRGRAVLTWKNCHSNDIHNSTDLSSNDMRLVWSLIGFFIFCNGKIIETIVVLAIAVFAATFLTTTYQAYRLTEGTPNWTNAPNICAMHYYLLKDVAEELSLCIGECLLAYMIDTAITFPIAVQQMFSGSVAVFFALGIKESSLVIGLLLAAIASLQVEWIKDRFIEDDSAIREPKSMGLGYPGLFLLNFRLLLSFFSIEGTLIMVLYEVTKN